jgi:FkbM family methyltransferase
MMDISRSLKRLLVAVLPNTAIDALKIRRFYRIFDNYQKTDFPESGIFERLVQPGYTVLDVGANVGLITKLLSEMVGDSGMVHSFEPVPYTYRILEMNIKRSGKTNVAYYDCAISERDGEAMIEVPTYAEMPDRRYDNSGVFGQVRNYYGAHLSRDGTFGGVKINTRSIDSLFGASSRRISFIKCDAEGFELECIRGARAILERDHPALFIELGSDPDEEGSPTWQMTELLQSLGYAPYLFDEGKLKRRSSGSSPRLASFANVDLFYLTEAQYVKAKR